MRKALESAKQRLESIQMLIDQQVDEKLEGTRQRYNWSSIIATISGEALAGIEDADAALSKPSSQSPAPSPYGHDYEQH